MGFTPSQVNEMSLWEFNCCASGFRPKGNVSSGEEMSDDDMRALGIKGF